MEDIKKINETVIQSVQVKGLKPGKIQKQQKQQKQMGPKIPSTVPKKDHYQRLTYLYKLGTIMTSKLADSNTTESNYKLFDTLSRSYMRNMDLVSKKAVLKLHPNIKRSTCKNCSRLLISGINSQIRIANESKDKLSHCDVLEINCNCGKSKRFPIGANQNYQVFADREEVLHDVQSKKK